MSGARPGRQGLRQALLVLGLLSGLFGMHGLTANHWSPCLMPDVATATAATTTMLMAGTVSVIGPVIAAPADRGGPGGQGGPGSHSGSESCLAMLAAAAVLLLLVGARRAPYAVVRPASLVFSWRGLRPGPPRSLALSLAQLCLARR